MCALVAALGTEDFGRELGIHRKVRRAKKIFDTAADCAM
jgi:hypothetical protein